jgi:hypothetical protein
VATLLADIRAALTTQVKAVVTDAQMSGYLLASPTTPSFELQLHEHDGITYDLAMGRGLDKWRLVLRGFVSNGFDIEAQKRLDGWLASSGGESIKAAVESDRTLGGAVSNVHVSSAGGHRSFTVASLPHIQFLGAEWIVDILSKG